MKRRLVILTEIIAPYRIPVFNALAGHPEIDLYVIFFSETDQNLRQWPVYKREIHFSYEVLPSWRCRISRYNVLLNFGVASALDRAVPAAVLCGGYSYLSSWMARSWARRHQAPLLLWCESTEHDARPGYATVEFLKARFLNYCEAFVVPGKSSSSYLASLGVAQEEIFTAPNAVDIDFFSRHAGLAQNSPHTRAELGLPDRFFLYVGRLVTEKGIFDLLEAYAKLAPEIRSAIGLVFVGDGAERKELTRRISDFGSDSVRCLGFAHREELAQVYGLAEAFVFPTHTDPWGLVVNEAMACGLPIIITNVAGCAADLVQDGWNGLVVPARNPASLTSAMSWLAGRPQLGAQMGARSVKRIQSYSPEACAAGMANAVKIVCSRER